MEFKAKKLDSPMGVGDMLREKREAMGLGTKEVAERIKIQKKYLERLEEGEYHLLPAPLYAKSFLKKYAEFLGLETGVVLLRFEEESAATLPSSERDYSQRKTGWRFSPAFFVITPFRVRVFLISFCFFLFFGYLAYHVYGFIGAPKIELTTPDTATVETQEDGLEMRGKVLRASRLTIDGKEVYLNEGGSFSERVSLEMGTHTITLRATSSFRRTNELSITVFRK